MNRALVLLVCLVMAGLVGLQYYQLRSNQAFQRDMAQELSAIKAELEVIQKDNNRLEEELASLRGKDVGVMVEDASEALVTGWNTMLDVLESELRKAEKALQERSEKQDSGGQETE